MENQPLLRRRRSRGVTIVAVLLALLVLTSLGAWQLKRLAWKEELLTLLDERSTMGPVDFAALPQPLADHVWRPVSLGGQWLPAVGLAVGPRTLEGKYGAFIFAPFRLADDRVILVNRGWAPSLTHAQPPQQDAVLTGIVRTPEKGRFAPDNNPAENKWYWPDLKEMMKAQGLADDAAVSNVYVQLTQTTATGYPQPVPSVPDLRNDHLQYAIFWFAMAGMLLVFFALTQHRRRRDDISAKDSNP